ncbi:Methionine synthase B12-binding module cap domain protein [Desulfofundulus kuznetsovii DSM 6115]|uniref:Methionine synthase B12-binding module cap domain protein n=1 Tax=Desulfofundulus kuznetsovii (strain DSM 6115 / VKM B-1805 / 17) TaxID=760568 RepID=A0AAU8PQG2_DESK7|nr:Methionine synthase B12-binding module cap domain protein [Desulfofundulus kuznetsovii DSM 6115]
MTPEREKEILERLAEAVLNYDEDAVRQAAQEALDEGMDANKAVFDGMVEGMKKAGDLYEQQEYFVPELLMCADAMYAGLEILRPHMQAKKDDSKVKGQVVMGVVQGDVHDIGKNLVKIMFEAAGFEVHDLGKDVPLEKFVEEQLKTDSEIVALSAMMTTTMVGMKDIIKAIKEKNPKAKIMIGGAPVTDEIADRFGADGYAKDASNALKEAINMIASLREL